MTASFRGGEESIHEIITARTERMAFLPGEQFDSIQKASRIVLVVRDAIPDHCNCVAGFFKPCRVFPSLRGDAMHSDSAQSVLHCTSSN
jgi:hypothetical protein